MKVKGLFYIWVFSLVLLLGVVKNGITATVSTSDIAEGDAAWYELTVGTTGVVDVNAWTDGSTENDDVSIFLYDPTGKQVSGGNGYNNKVSITYTATTTGTFKVQVYLSNAYNGGTRKITVSSPYQLSASPHYKVISDDIVEADAVWYELTVGSTGVVGINTWTDGSTENDDVSIYLYDPTGKQVSGGNGYNNKVSITYIATSTGTFKVRIYLSNAYNGGTRKITTTSNYSLSAFNTTSTPTPSPTPSPTTTTTLPSPTPTPTPSPSPSPSPSPTSTPTGGLVAYYPFNGNANDESGNGNNGTVNGATLTNDRNGNANKAYSFDGTDDYIDIGSDSSLKMKDGLTISVWVNMNYYTPIYQNIISDHAPNETTEGVGKMLRFNYNELQFHVGGIYGYGTAVYVKHTFNNSMLSQWHHIVGTYDRNTIKLFLNGVEVASRQYTSQLAVNSNPILIGKSGFGEYLYGKVDNIRIYNRALSESEILELYNEGGSTTPTPSPTPSPSPSPTPTVTSTQPIPSPTPVKEGVVYGTVNDSFDETLEGVTVTITGEGISDSTETDGDGYYEFKGLAAGNYTLKYEQEGYVTQTTNISLEEGDEKDLGTVTMPLMSTCYGYVFDIKGNPIKNAKLKLKGINTGHRETKYSDGDGYFEFTGLEADTYLLFVRKKGYIPKKVKFKLKEGEEKDVGEITLRRKS